MEVCTAFHNRIFLFICACLSGILFALVWRKYEQTVELSMVYNHYSSSLRSSGYNLWLKKQGYIRKHLSEEDLRFSDKNKYVTPESYFLYQNAPVLCLVFVNSHSGAEAVKNTWSKHCNIVTFFGRFVDKKIPVMKVPPLTSFEGFCYAFVHVWKKYKHKFHWVLIADDSTYVLIENLRYYIAPLNSSLHYYLGHAVKDFSSMYNVASAGIILSHGSLALLYSLYQSATECSNKGAPSWYFDQALGKILETFSVNPVDTRDTYSRGRFNPFSAETMLIPGSISVFSSYWRTSAFLSGEGMDCCSDYAITFHDVSPSKMYLLEYLLHHMAVFRHSPLGLGNKPVSQEFFPNPKDNEIDEFIVKESGKPFIQLLDKNWVSVKSSKHTSKEKERGILESFWNDFFW